MTRVSDAPSQGAVPRRTGGVLVLAAITMTTLHFASHRLAADEAVLASTGPVGDEPIYFEDTIEPLLQRHCIDCHGSADGEAMLDLAGAAGVMAGSDSGPIVAPGSRRHSLLYEVVHSGEMPPDGESLDADEIELLGAWADAGAHFRDPPAGALTPPNQHDVLPILLLRCAACHGAQVQRAGLDLRSIDSLRAGGEGGAVAIAGDPDASAMIQRVESEACPPQDELLKYFVVRPGQEEVETLRRWIAAGMPEVEVPEELIAGAPDEQAAAAGRRHWAFQPLPRQVAVPTVADPPSAHPIDAFIGEKLRQQGLAFSPQAPRHQLIRRVFVDLTGIPPTLDQLARWMDDPDPQWYAALVDHLLASPRYGERWGRHWLDVAGYSDSEGGQSADTVRQFAWKYRDYVIRSLNQDKPWNRFLLEQLAGDELAEYRDQQAVTEEVVDNLIATGFLRMGVDETGSRTMNFVPERLGLIADAIDVVGSGVMGLTMECARCHSHKYDPIPHTDYFRFKAIFQGAFDEHDWMSWKTRKLEVATPQMVAQREATNKPLEEQIKSLQGQRRDLVKSWQDRYYDEAWPQLDHALQEQITAARKARDGRRTLRQQELLRRYETEIRPTEAVLVSRHEELAERLEQIDRQLQRLQQQIIPPLTIRALWDRGRPSPTYVLIRGEHERFGRLVGPGVPSALTDGQTPLHIEPPWPGAESTGRRLALARWLTDPDHPLTARVLVNRVWSLHFGRGIVNTLDNFGMQGATPTHPELLDWLARDFVDSGWSLKTLHRRILRSRTYRQSSRVTDQHQQQDPENLYLARMVVRRMDAEALRDSIIALAGRLDDSLYGPPSPVTVRDDGMTMETPGIDGRLRRSIYLQLRRTEMPSLLSLFDYPEMQPNCLQRSTSTVSLQSLILKNNERIFELAGDLAADLVDRADREPTRLVELAYRATYGRMPEAQEAARATAALRQFTELWRDQDLGEGRCATTLAMTTLCHTLVNSAEFSYLD